MKFNNSKSESSNFRSIDDLNVSQYIDIFLTATKMMDTVKSGGTCIEYCQGKILSIVFFDPSTRTSTVLQSAMARLGGSSIIADLRENSYWKNKRETLLDTIFSYAVFSDILAIRHKELDLTELSLILNVPLINSMCGSSEHSLAALGRAFSLFLRFSNLAQIKVGIYGAIHASRPLKGLIKILSLFGSEIYYDPVVPEILRSMDLDISINSNINVEALDTFISEIDVLFIAEGVLQEGIDNYVCEKYYSQFKTISNFDLEKLKNNSIVSYGMPRLMPNGKFTILPELDCHQKIQRREFLDEWIFGTMAIIHFLLN